MKNRDFVLPEPEFLKSCEVLTRRASGPGGMHRDHNATAVRIRHRASGIEAVASERRQQSLNRKRAIERLRKKLAIMLRAPVPPADKPLVTSEDGESLFAAGKKTIERLKAMALALDVLESHSGRIGEAARRLGMTTSRLNRFLQSGPGLWAEANRIRERHGQPRLKKR